MIDIAESREKIDRIDKEIVALFEERMEVARDVAEYKRQTGKKVLDVQREKEKLEKLSAMASSKFNQRALEELFSQIMSISRKYQYTLLEKEETAFEPFKNLPKTPETRVCFFGAHGSYTEQAMQHCFGTKVQATAAGSFREVMEAVQNRQADYGVLPIENTTTGGITDSYDLLMEYDNYIVAEHVIRIEHALLTVPGTEISEVKTIYSHPQAISQCRKFLEEHPQIRIEVMASTSESARYVMLEGDREKAAIAGKQAAELYGLDIRKECLNTEEVNSTRFIIISGKKEFLEHAGKVCVCFELPHESGSLYKMLSHIMYNNLNMTKIESRPIAGKNFEYRFFVEFEGCITDAAVRNTLNGIREEASGWKMIGTIATV